MKTINYHPESDCLFTGVLSGPDYDQGVDEVDLDDLRAGSRIQVTFDRYSTVQPSGDFETYSEAGYVLDDVTKKVKSAARTGKGGLPCVGTPVYCEHPTAEVLCFWYDLKDGNGRQCWLPGLPNPTGLFDHVANGGTFEAFNVTFEWYVWNLICVRKYGWPPLPLEQCVCVMARCRRHSLPGGLDNASKVLGTAAKDPEGKRLITKLTRPHSPTKKRPEWRWTTDTAWDDFLALYNYGEGDVKAEDEVAARVPDLTPDEHAVWQLDQRINARGVQVDTVTLDAALDVLQKCERKYTLELATLTNGEVGSVSEVAKMLEWVNSRAVEPSQKLPDLTAGTIKDVLSQPDAVSSEVRKVLEIRQALGSANVKKLRALKLQISSDGRLRDQYTYCGADRTGRASAGGVQLQNITAKGPKTSQCGNCGGIFGRSIDAIGCPRCGEWGPVEDRAEWDIDAVRWAVEDVRTGDLDHVEKMWGAAIPLLCGCLRGLFCARPGYKFVCVDFSAIEAVGAACLSRCQWRFDVFCTHGKIYEMSAATLTGKTLDFYLQYKKDNGTHHADRQPFGKIPELASGYGGWINAWKAFGADKFMDDQTIKEAILKWREASPEIVEMWGGQFKWCGPGKWDYRPELHGLEGAAISAVMRPGEWFHYLDISYLVQDEILYCRLPSGRYLHYHQPMLVPAEDKLNRGPAVSLTFMGYNSNPAKGPTGWHRLETFGGRLFENVDQAVCADIQFEAALRVEAAGYPLVMHTHDELVAEVPESWGSVEEMEALMSERPSWASWWPIRAAGWTDTRYQKD